MPAVNSVLPARSVLMVMSAKLYLEWGKTDVFVIFLFTIFDKSLFRSFCLLSPCFKLRKKSEEMLVGHYFFVNFKDGFSSDSFDCISSPDCFKEVILTLS